VAITNETIQAAVEQFLPRTANYAYDSKTGEKDLEVLFRRIMQVLLTALLLDDDAIFYVVYLAVQRLRSQATDLIDDLETLQGTTMLRAIKSGRTTKVTDFSKLERARKSLARIRSRLAAGGGFSSSHFESFKADLMEFLSSQVTDKLIGRNRVILEAEIKAEMASLKTSWADLLERKGHLFDVITEFQAVDLKSKVSLDVATLAEDQLASLQAGMETASASSQAEQAESIILVGVAAKAALAIVNDAPNPFGETICGPLEDGHTESSYLTRLGHARPEPMKLIARGFSGKLLLGTLLASTAGTLTDDEDDDGLTPLLDDLTVDFTTVAEVGMFITFAKVGRSHRVTAVSATQLTLFPEVPLALSDTRYVLTRSAPGALFQDVSGALEDEAGNPIAAFWTTGTGSTGSTTIASGISGEFVGITRGHDTDGRNAKAYGTAGETHPTKWLNTTGLIQEVMISSTTGTFRDSSATSASSYDLEDASFDFTTENLETRSVVENLSGALYPGTYYLKVVYDTTRIVLMDIDENNIQFSSGSETGITYEIRRPDDVLSDDYATFLSSGVVSGDVLTVLSAGTYIIDDVLSETDLTVEDLFGVTEETMNVVYSIERSDADYVFTDAAASFIADGVEAGNTIVIDGVFYEVATVESSTTLTVTTAFGGSASGLAWYVPLADGVFVSDSAYFQSSLTVAGDRLSINSVGTFYVIEVTDQHGLVVDGTFGASVGFYDGIWQLYEADADGDVISNVFRVDLTTDMTGWGPIMDGRRVHLVIEDVEYGLLQVYDLDQWEVQVSAKAKTATARTWKLEYDGGTTTFTSASATFLASASPGDILVLRPGELEERAVISEVVSDTEVTLTREVTADLVDVEYALINLVKPGMDLHAGGRTARIVNVVDATTLLVSPTLPGTIGKDVEYLVTSSGGSPRTRRLVDDQASFTEDLVGQDIDLGTRPPSVGTILRVVDEFTLDVSTKAHLGRRGVHYRIRSASGGTTHGLLSEIAEDPSIAEGDFLTVWGQEGVLTVASAPWTSPVTTVTVLETLDKGLSDEHFIVMRGGSEHHGRYLLLEHEAEGLVLSEDTKELRLHVAEVFTDFGEGAESGFALSGAAGRAVDDMDGDLRTGIFEDATAAFLTAGVQAGDRLTIGDVVSYVYAVSSETRLVTSPEIPTSLAAASWALDRNSISFAINAVAALQAQVAELVAVLDNYTIPVNGTVHDALGLLRQHGMGRAAESLMAGDMEDFLAIDASSSTSFAGAAKSSVQAVGQAILESSGSVSASSTTASSSSSATTAGMDASATETGDDEPDILVALAASSRTLAGSERSSTVAQLSQDELKNRAIYALIGEIESGVVSDSDPTLPWVAETGSKKAQLEAEKEAALASLDYMLANPTEFASE